jgi:hypothetical protein
MWHHMALADSLWRSSLRCGEAMSDDGVNAFRLHT